MSVNAAVDIHALIAAGRVVEAGALLAMHGEELPPDMRQELEQERQRLWQRASDLVIEGEALEQAGWTEEAWNTYQKAAKIACDLPGLQDTLKRMDEAVALTRAVQHRSKRIRQNAARVVRSPQTSRRRSPLLLAAVVLLSLGAGWWLVKSPPKIAPTPVQTPPITAPAASQTIPPAPSPTTASGPTAEAIAPQTAPSETLSASTSVAVPQQLNAGLWPSTAQTAVSAPSNPVTPPSATPLPPASPAAHTYTVQAGDTLALIAARQLCLAEGWPAIYKKNRKLITHPDKLLIGTQLDLSDLPNRCQQPQ